MKAAMLLLGSSQEVKGMRCHSGRDQPMLRVDQHSYHTRKLGRGYAVPALLGELPTRDTGSSQVPYFLIQMVAGHVNTAPLDVQNVDGRTAFRIHGLRAAFATMFKPSS
jgi:hypothetical protein